MASKHDQVVALAEAGNEHLAQIFAQLGGSSYPNAPLLRAYRVAQLALVGGFADAQAVDDALHTLRAAIESIIGNAIANAALFGANQAQLQLAVYNLDAVLDHPLHDTLLAAWLADVDAQLQAVRTLALTGLATPAEIVGDGDRAGVLAPGLIIANGTRWVAIAAQQQYADVITAGTRRTRQRWMRQAVATISANTTNCCLTVHGQVVELEQDFKLTGTPRYADAMRHPPFHRYCRTVEALLLADEADDDTTQQMQAAANNELIARTHGGTTQRHRSGTALAG